MRIDELKRIAEENDYKQLENKHKQFEHKLEFRRNTGGLGNIVNQIAIREEVENRIFFNINYCDEKDLNMIKASIELAETPPEDREEEKKFYLRHRYFKCTNGDSRYFQIYESNGNPWLNAMYSVMGYKKQFTLDEIEEIKEKFDTDLKDFELVEVEDD